MKNSACYGGYILDLETNVTHFGKYQHKNLAPVTTTGQHVDKHRVIER